MSKKNSTTKKPSGELTIRTLAMPSHVNLSGDIFGGWIVSQMDLAGASLAYKFSKARITTVAIDSMSFINPVHIGDFVSCYAELIKVGNSSMQIKIETWTNRGDSDEMRQVTEGIFTFVAIDKSGRPIPAKPNAR
ncbi:MAG: acyl-CoA thioesterase [Gammaproteobacteria bacterium]|nr:acyl-CoA thioesterase [Gammaproteobacteria bacterium]